MLMTQGLLLRNRFYHVYWKNTDTDHKTAVKVSMGLFEKKIQSQSICSSHICNSSAILKVLTIIHKHLVRHMIYWSILSVFRSKSYGKLNYLNIKSFYYASSVNKLRDQVHHMWFSVTVDNLFSLCHKNKMLSLNHFNNVYKTVKINVVHIPSSFSFVL